MIYRTSALSSYSSSIVVGIFLLEDCKESQTAVRVKEPHFGVLEEFRGASYAKRYELFCRKLVRERHYDASAFLLSDRKAGQKGAFREPAEDLTFDLYIRSLVAHVGVHSAKDDDVH